MKEGLFEFNSVPLRGPKTPQGTLRRANSFPYSEYVCSYTEQLIGLRCVEHVSSDTHTVIVATTHVVAADVSIGAQASETASAW